MRAFKASETHSVLTTNPRAARGVDTVSSRHVTVIIAFNPKSLSEFR